MLGAGGMLGHKLSQRLGRSFDTVGAAREGAAGLKQIQSVTRVPTVGGLDVTTTPTVLRILDETQPTVVVNCVGIVKQRPNALDTAQSVRINSLFPHELAAMCHERHIRLVHVSTDCVFSGDRGSYRESDRPDPVDVYGLSKLLGEVHTSNAITLRTSIIGRELCNFHSLLEWFLRQPIDAEVKGYTRAVFSGFTTIALGDEIARLISDYPQVSGTYHVSAEPISKFKLLSMVKEVFGVRCTIIPDDAFHCDRSLVSDKYRSDVSFTPPSWKQMLEELASDPTIYPPAAAWRR